MVGFQHLSVLLVGIVLPWATAFPVIDKRGANVIPNNYIVTLKPGVPLSEVDAHLDWVREIQSRSVSRRDITGVDKVYSIEDFKAYAGSFDPATIEQIRNSAQVNLPLRFVRRCYSRV